jgi:hypothetical protein
MGRERVGGAATLEEERPAENTTPPPQPSRPDEPALVRIGSRRRVRVLLMVAAAGIGFQVFHFAEHLLQAGYWVVHPTTPPWLTPWAEVGRQALASASDGHPGTGNELLHLIGNFLLMVALLAALDAVRLARGAVHTPWLRRATWVQGAHLGEHAVLTATWVGGGRALGVTNLFGTIDPTSVLGSSTRVWVHFTINLVVTVMAVRGLAELASVRQRPKAPNARLETTRNDEPGLRPRSGVKAN